GYYKMQDMSTTICNNVYTSQLTDNSDTMEAQLIDVRDNNVYWVAKLKDNRCWLLENLKLNPTTTSLDDLQGNTNTPDTALYYFKNGGGSSPYATDAVTSTWNNYISGVDWTTPRINSEYKDAVSNNSYDQSGQWKIGIYYNYCAASAGSYCYPSDAGTGNADYDICSVNWHIPKVGGEYQALVNRYSNYADFRTIFRVPLSGNFESGQAYDQGQLGQFWTSTYYNTSSMHRLRIDSYSDINPTYAFSRSAGFAVRCIANN
ncbi:hypothetical protein IKG05_00750, partial [Candidatus Saccharibacteria bacterium]|nr:hypothetical protein [Candidatus Saccharibacteria bacterium]